MKNRIVLSFAIGLLITSFAAADGLIPFNITAPGGPIPELQPPNTDGISVFPLTIDNPPITNIKTFELVLTGLSHTSPEDLDIYLIDPFGTTLEVMSDKGGTTDINYVTLVFSDTGGSLPADGSPLLSGTYHTEGLAGLMGTYGGDSGGTDAWILLIIDDSLSDSGSLTSWTLRGTGVPEPVTLSLLALGALTFVRRRRA